MSDIKSYMEFHTVENRNNPYDQLSNDYITLNIRDFKYLFPKIELPKELLEIVDDSYYVRIRSMENSNGLEMEFSPDRDDWKCVV